MLESNNRSFSRWQRPRLMSPAVRRKESSVADHHPDGSSVPREFLVPPEFQPDFGELDGCVIPEFANLGDVICASARDAGVLDETACIHAESGRSYTYADLDRLSGELARGLVALGIARGDRVAFRSANSPDLAVLAIACWRAGAVTVPTPAQARGKELSFFLEDTGARVLFVQAGNGLFDELTGLADQLDHVVAFGEGAAPGWVTLSWTDLMELGQARGAQLPPVYADDVALIWHSGGTTGTPKAIYHTHRRALLGSYALARSTGVSPGSVWSAAAPAGHALGFASHTFWPLLHGARVVYIEAYSNPRSLVRAIQQYGIEGFAAITMTWARMLDVLDDDPSADVSSLRRTYAMWQSLASSEVYDAWTRRGVELLNNFGCTAFASWILAPRVPGPVPRGSLGAAVPGYEVAAVALDSQGFERVPVGTEGRLVARGVSGLTYWNRPEMQQRDVRDGWNLLDDLVVFDEDGNATYRGRLDNVVSTAGYKVSPVEVEEALGSHPAVREVGVIGAPDPLRQEIVAAFVVVKDGYESGESLVAELQEHVRSRLAPYKYPRRIEFVSELPRDHVGKLQPRALRAWAIEKPLVS
jgi:2-aminobenzoate-CoA ligase